MLAGIGATLRRKAVPYILGVTGVLCVAAIALFLYHSNKPTEPKTVYMLPESSIGAGASALTQKTPPVAKIRKPIPHQWKAEVSDGNTDSPQPQPEIEDDNFDEKVLKLFREIEQKEDKVEVSVSPFGFGAYPEVPSDFPETVIWETDIQEEISQYGSEQVKAVELMDRVLIKLWKQGHQATSASMTNRLVYPSFPNTVYVSWKYDTDSGGNRVVVGGTLLGDAGLTEDEADAVLEGYVPSGINVLSFDSDGIDPYDFLNLN